MIRTSSYGSNPVLSIGCKTRKAVCQGMTVRFAGPYVSDGHASLTSVQWFLLFEQFNDIGRLLILLRRETTFQCRFIRAEHLECICV